MQDGGTLDARAALSAATPSRIIEPAEHCLMINGNLPHAVRTLVNGVDKKPVKVLDKTWRNIFLFRLPGFRQFSGEPFSGFDSSEQADSMEGAVHIV